MFIFERRLRNLFLVGSRGHYQSAACGALDEFAHDLRCRLVSVNAVELMRHRVAGSGRRYDNFPGRTLICELTILRDHDEFLHGTPP